MITHRFSPMISIAYNSGFWISNRSREIESKRKVQTGCWIFQERRPRSMVVDIYHEGKPPIFGHPRHQNITVKRILAGSIWLKLKKESYATESQNYISNVWNKIVNVDEWIYGRWIYFSSWKFINLRTSKYIPVYKNLTMYATTLLLRTNFSVY